MHRLITHITVITLSHKFMYKYLQMPNNMSSMLTIYVLVLDLQGYPTNDNVRSYNLIMPKKIMCNSKIKQFRANQEIVFVCQEYIAAMRNWRHSKTRTFHSEAGASISWHHKSLA
jgi:hypothetical protein